MPTTATTTTRRYTCVRARLGDSAGSIPATCIAGYLFATDKVHVKQTDLCARANNVSYEALDDEYVLQYFGILSGTPSFDLEDDFEHKNKGHIRIQRPKLDI